MTRAAGADAPTSAELQVAQQGGRVVIAGVQPYSSAARAGVRAGQTIISANGREVSTVDQLADVVRGAENRALSLIVEYPQAGRIIINYELQP